RGALIRRWRATFSRCGGRREGKEKDRREACPFDCRLLLPILLLTVLAARGPLSLQRFVLLALFRREERKDALLLRVAQLRHLRALRFGGALQSVEARGVVRLFRGADFLPRRTDLLEERLVLLAKALVEVADLRLLRI